MVRQFRPIQLTLALAALAWLGVSPAGAQPRSASAPRQAPALPQSGAQTEAVDLNDGKTPAQMFTSDCAVCHQKPNGLAKDRSVGQLAGFLRQHYTTGTQQAGLLAAYLTSGGLERGAPAPAVARDAPERPGAGVPVVRPPAPIGTARRPADNDDAGPEAAPSDGRRKPAATEASKPADRDTPASRRPGREETRRPSERHPAASARAPKPAAPEIRHSEAPAASAAPPETPAATPAPAAPPPAEEKPAAPPPPPAPEIRI